MPNLTPVVCPGTHDPRIHNRLDRPLFVKIVVDGVGARIAEAIGALVILLWLKQAVPEGIIKMPLDTRWMSWTLLATVVIWLFITHGLSIQVKRENVPSEPLRPENLECERSPDQCPCTTELGKGVA